MIRLRKLLLIKLKWRAGNCGRGIEIEAIYIENIDYCFETIDCTYTVGCILKLYIEAIECTCRLML